MTHRLFTFGVGVCMGPDGGLVFRGIRLYVERAGRFGSPRRRGRLAAVGLLLFPVGLYMCRRSEMPSSDAANVMQEVFLAVWRGLAGFHREQTGQTFRGWLRIIARNKITDHFRRQATLPEVIGGGSASTRRLWRTLMWTCRPWNRQAHTNEAPCKTSSSRSSRPFAPSSNRLRGRPSCLPPLRAGQRPRRPANSACPRPGFGRPSTRSSGDCARNLAISTDKWGQVGQAFQPDFSRLVSGWKA